MRRGSQIVGLSMILDHSGSMCGIELHWVSLICQSGSIRLLYSGTCLERPPILLKECGLSIQAFSLRWQVQLHWNAGLSIKCGLIRQRVLMAVQWNLSWETTSIRDHLSWKIKYFWQKVLHFNVFEPVTKDHLYWQTTFLWQWCGLWRQGPL